MSRKTLGVASFVVGVAMLFGSMYIKSKVAEGREQISSAQEKVDQGKGLFSLSPYTKDIGDELTGRAEKKIQAGSAQADRYEKIAFVLQVGGIGLMVLGVGLMVLRKKR